MRSKGNRGQGRAVGLEHKFLRLSFCSRIMGVEASRVGSGLIDSLHITAIENNARRTGVNQSLDAMPPTGVNHVLRADDVRTIVILIRSPDAGFGGSMEDNIAALRS